MSWRLYFAYARVSVASQWQDRWSFYLLAIANMVGTSSGFLGVWALFDRFGSLRGWTLPQVAFFYGVVNVGFALAEALARGFDSFANLIRKGDFDRLLLRPPPTVLQVAASELQVFRVGRLAQGLLVLGWSVVHLGLVWTAPRVALVLAMVLSDAGLFYGLFVVQATLSFWTVDGLEIMNAVTYGGTEAAQYPFDIYRPWFAALFTIAVPLAATNYLPASAVFPFPHAVTAWAAWGPLAGPLFLALCIGFWRFGTRHYQSTGS